MASQIRGAPICPTRNRSDGIEMETSTTIIWSKGAWRYAIDASYCVDLTTADLECPCGELINYQS